MPFTCVWEKRRFYKSRMVSERTDVEEEEVTGEMERERERSEKITRDFGV